VDEGTKAFPFVHCPETRRNRRERRAAKHQANNACAYVSHAGFKKVFFPIRLHRTKGKAFDAKDFIMFLLGAFAGRLLRLSCIAAV
jgi:hypothetical protein